MKTIRTNKNYKRNQEGFAISSDFKATFFISEESAKKYITRYNKPEKFMDKNDIYVTTNEHIK